MSPFSAHLSAHMALWQGGSKEKSLTNSLYQNQLGFKRKTGLGPAHLGKVELYH